jgi:hypothetical protein
MTGIRRVSQLGTTGESTYVDGSIQTADIAANVITQAKLSTDIPLSGMRNAIINGGMDIWQRGTGSIAPASGVMTNTDRWVHTGTTTTFTQQTDVPAGFRYSIGASGSDATFGQKIEAANAVRLASQTVTFSVWAKSISGSRPLDVYFLYPTSVDNFASLASISTTVAAASVSSSWTRYTLTVTLPAAVANGLYVLFGRSGSATNTYYTGAQLEVGSQPTPFEQRPYGVELSLCQRYLIKWSVMVNSGRLAHGIASSTTSVSFGLPYKVQPRTHLGTLTVEGALTISDTTATFTPSSYSRFDAVCTDDYYGITAATSSVTTYRTYYLEGNGNPAANIRSDMEL